MFQVLGEVIQLWVVLSVQLIVSLVWKEVSEPGLMTSVAPVAAIATRAAMQMVVRSALELSSSHYPLQEQTFLASFLTHRLPLRRRKEIHMNQESQQHRQHLLLPCPYRHLLLLIQPHLKPRHRHAQ
jgi:hypothetical protein